MNDERLRELERIWQESASDEDELAWNRERARLGLPLRVSTVAIRILPFESGLDDDAIVRNHTGAEEWARVIEEAERGVEAPWLACDLAAVNYIQSGLIAELLNTHGRLQKRNGGLVLCGLPPRTLDVFQLLGLGELFFEFATSLAACLRERQWEPRGPLVKIERILYT